MKYRVEPIDNWLWGNLSLTKSRLKRIKKGMMHKRDNDPANEMCPFCGKGASMGGDYTEEMMQIYPCEGCLSALAYGYLTEVMKIEDNS